MYGKYFFGTEGFTAVMAFGAFAVFSLVVFVQHIIFGKGSPTDGTNKGFRSMLQFVVFVIPDATFDCFIANVAVVC